MEKKASFQLLPTSLLTKCKLTICDKIPSYDENLCAFITDTLKFKITNTAPLVIEKDNPSPDDINKLLDALKEVLQLHNRKDKLVELKQREGNATCASLVQTSSLREALENRQLTGYTIKNYCDNSSYEVSSQQAQGINDEVLDITNTLQNLEINDVSHDNDHIQENNQFENSLSGNATFTKLTSTPPGLENENISLMENATDAENQENNSRDRGEDKKQEETTQPEYLRKHVETAQQEYLRTQVETTQPEYLRKQVETTQPEYHRKQVQTTQPEYLEKQVETTQPEYLRKQVEDTQPEYLRKQVETTQPEYLRKQVETTQPEYLGKQVETAQPEYDRKQIETTQPEYDRKQVATTQPEYDRRQVQNTQPEYPRTQVETTQPEYLRKQVETTQPEYLGKQVETAQPEYDRKQVETTQPEYDRKQVATTQPEYDRRQVQNTQPEYPRTQVETTQPESHRTQVDSTQPEYLGKQVETTQPEYLRKQAETTQPEYDRRQVQNTQPEYPRKQVETTQPEYLRKQVETTQPEYLGKQVETAQPEYDRKQVETTQPEYDRKQVATTQPEYDRRQVQNTQPEYPRTQVETTQPESHRTQVDSTQPEYLGKQVETTQPEYLRKQAETTQPEYDRRQVQNTQPEYPRKKVETTQPEYLRKQVETTKPEYLGKQVETTQPEYHRKQVETAQPEYLRKQVETTQPEYHRKQVETTQPEYDRKQVQTTQPEYPRKKVETTQSEYHRTHVETTQPEYHRKQVETTQPEYPRKQVETTQPEYLRTQIETTQPEYLRTQIETTQPEYLRTQIETTQPEYPRKQVETTQPEYLRTPIETTQPEYIRTQIETTQPEYLRTQIETTQPEYLRTQVETTQPEYLRTQVEITQPDYLRTQVETTQPGYPRKQVETTQSEYLGKKVETTQPEYLTTQEKITQPEYLRTQDNVTQHNRLECGKQGKIGIQVHSQDTLTIKENRGILKTNTRTDMSHANNTSEMQTIVSGDANINKEMKMQIHVDDKNENNNMTSSNFAYRPETIEDHAGRTSSIQNVYPSSMNDIASQEHLHQRKDSASADMQISLKDGGSKNTSFNQRELETSKISPRSNKIQDNTDSSDSDAESENFITFSMKASLVDDIKMYLNESRYVKYFIDAKKNEGNIVLFKLNTNNDRDVSFLNTLKQLKVEECEFYHKDIHLNSDVQDIQTQTGVLIIQIKDNKVHIVGLKNSVASAKKRLQLLLQNHDKQNSHHQNMATVDKSTASRTESLEKNNPDTRNQGTRAKMSDDEKTHELRPQKSELNEMHQRVLESRTSLAEDSYHKNKADRTTYPENSEHCIFSNGYNIYYAKNKRSTLTVQIVNTDITKLEVDCIVNAANKRLQHYGGVAKAISSAAGPALRKECEDFIQSGNQVAVADIFVSTGGKMPSKFVIHAVGPKWESYGDNSKSQCLTDLRHTVIRCLIEADRRGFTSIALPSISAAIFKVPKEACAGCYMKAVKHFGILNGEKTSLCDIRFVDVDEAMVNVIQEHFQRNWMKPCDPHIVQEDDEFAKEHVFSASRNAAKNTKKLPDTNKLTSSSSSSSSVSTKTPGASKSSSVVGDRSRFGNTVASGSDLRTERNSIYQIGKFTLHTDTRPAFNHSADITITVGQPFDKLSGLHDFSVSYNMKTKEGLKNTFKVFTASKPNGQQEKVVCALLPEPDSADTIKEAIENLSTIIQSPNKRIFMQNIRKVVLTSSILYEEPSNTQKKGKKRTYDRKKVGDFARCLFDYLNHASGITTSSMSVTVVGSDDALQTIHKVLESRPVKKISLEVHQGARSSARDLSPSHYHGNSGQHSLYASQDTNSTKQHREEVHQGARSSARDLSPSHYHGNSGGQHSLYASQDTNSTKQHHEEVHQGARSSARDLSPSHYHGNSGQHSLYASQDTNSTKQHREEVHQGARSSARDLSPSHYHGNSGGQHSLYASQDTNSTKQHHEEDVGSSVDSENVCVICAWQKPAYPVRCCGKYLCHSCEQRISICPYCRAFWRVSLGDQPPGTMSVSTKNDHADGYENTSVWEINYSFPPGLQKEHHPHPGKTYIGMIRRAFLPINEDGWYVLKLLRLAFLRKLTFTIGRSLTMNREDSIIWNDIHHKTNLHGGPYGYPDPNYLFNVTQELARKGVTFNTVLEHERYDLDQFVQCVEKYGWFIDIHPK